MARKATSGWWKRPKRSIGFQTGSPKMTAEADVTAIPMNE